MILEENLRLDFNRCPICACQPWGNPDQKTRKIAL